ncbi:MAG: DUF433 domain-containing protein [Bacteroidetes bacterium]|jgi:uncharacterized protein (DUF433 family)|nr:DUF433 domain-containing protein [Bacteroidota bacterium]MBT6687958.1 DUF433 domain-containing protein [Bacteroidota bacterium]MBT7143297.1 DUF433 domain-containing protein [Bacteroidota bacterium]MBT7490278.1 DUF433 domain-containing protein [Bacteroidota bacterium]
MERITINPKIAGGRPIIAGSRISVEFILNLLASGVSEDEILQDYSHIIKEDLHACYKYLAHFYKNIDNLNLEVKL